MIREHIFSGRTPTDPHFRWRGGDVSRIEGLTDAAFAFSITFLVVGAFRDEITTARALIDGMREVAVLAPCFVVVIWIWSVHHQFFRRYGLEDQLTIVLNSAFLFAVMVYVYPLKFLFRFVIENVIFRLPSKVPGSEVVGPNEALPMMQIYGGGFIAIFGLLALMTHNGMRQRDRLQLDAIEIEITRNSIVALWLTAAVGAVSVILTVLPLPMHVGVTAGLSGMIYSIIGPIRWIHGVRSARRVEALAANLTPIPETGTTD